ncbi:replication-relaxation family protein, partial [Streptomyces mirabilis]|uniref:replication-relaxation family protein n=1 Tax=Streptomyces mirabilis TaxID=68239 RepID=UPI00382B034E
MSASRPQPDQCGDLRVCGRVWGECGRLSAGLSEGIAAWSTEALSLRDRGRALVVGVLVGAGCCCDRYARCRTGRCRTGREASGSMMIGVDAGSGDRLALAVLTQYRMATTEQMHRVIAPSVRIEQTRRRLARLRAEGLVDR